MFIFNVDFFHNYHLKQNLKEDQHYKVLDDHIWKYLFNIYGGKDVPRVSITVRTEDISKPDYVVETMLRRFKIVSYP